MDLFTININYDNILDIFNGELASIKINVIKECIKYMIKENIIKHDKFDEMEKGLLDKLKNK